VTAWRAKLVAAAVMLAATVAVTAIVLLGTTLEPAHSTYTPRDPVLRRKSLYFYLPAGSHPAARALVFFFGNDIGFWAPHQELASDLASQGYAVIGYDVTHVIKSLPPGDTPAAARARDSIFASQVDTLLRVARHELHMERSPVILLGHSFGAELALWTAHRVVVPGLRGVVAMSPAARGHLMITLHDLANVGDPYEPGSVSVAATAAALPPTMRIALVRGDHDRLRSVDSAIIAAGGSRLRYYSIPMASHSLKHILIARYVVRSAVDWVAADRPVP
jgi:pimeloyl-ACP methyl ester carboxylesterase